MTIFTILLGLSQNLYNVDVIVAYRTLPAHPDPQGLVEIRRGADWLTFTSPSTIENFILLIESAGMDALHLPGAPRLACIGPLTAEAARQAGFRDIHMAEEYTRDFLCAPCGLNAEELKPQSPQRFVTAYPAYPSVSAGG